MYLQKVSSGTKRQFDKIEYLGRKTNDGTYDHTSDVEENSFGRMGTSHCSSIEGFKA